MSGALRTAGRRRGNFPFSQRHLQEPGGYPDACPDMRTHLRGITWLAPVLLRLHELDRYEDAAMVKAKVAALFTGFTRDPDGIVADLNGASPIYCALRSNSAVCRSR